MFFLNPANHTTYFCDIESDINPGYISININPVPFGDILIKVFPVSVFFYNLRKSFRINHSCQVANLNSVQSMVMPVRPCPV